MKVKSKHYEDETKCPGCNWRVCVLYSFPSNPIDREGLCASCFMDKIVEERLDVSSKGG